MHECAATLILGGRGSFAYVERVAISISTVRRWTTDDIERYIHDCVRLGSERGTFANVSHFLGELPGPAARKRIDQIVPAHIERAKRTLLLAESPFLRGAATAWAWMTNEESLAVRPEDRRRGIEWVVRGTSSDADRIERSLVDCYRVLGVEVPGSR